jgi:dienelactone hydrolase
MTEPFGYRSCKVTAAAILLASVLASGCVGQLRTPYQPPPQAAKPAPESGIDTNLFTYASGSAPTEAQLPTGRRHYDSVNLEFPPLARNGAPAVQMSATYYRSTLPTARKLVIVLPIWGSYRYPPRKTVNTLLKRSKGDMHVLEVHGEDPLFFWDQLRDAPTEEAFTQLAGDMTGRVMDTVISIRQLLDWIEQQPEVDPQRIGLVGFSMGAIVAAIALGVDERIAGGVLMMGAGKPGHVFATCNSYPGEVRKAAMERFGWSLERYQQLFDELFAMGDPALFAHQYKPEALLIIDGAFDGCMSREARDALWQATGKPEKVSFLSQHQWSFLSLTPLALNVAGKKIHDFLEHTLATEERVACSTTAACP